MKKVLMAIILLGVASVAFADSYTLDADSRRVTVSTIPTSATQLFSASDWGRSITDSWILNDSAFNLAISPDANITTNTVSGLFYILPNTLFSFGEYKGELYGVVLGTTVPQSVGVLRKK